MDLNLLVAFDALMTERSVTLAAQRLSIGQSAMSSTLGRLRKLLNDPILVREGRTMLSTPLADSLVEPVRDALSRIELLFQYRGFDPAVDRRTFSVIATDRTTLTFLQPLVNGLHTEAPNVRLQITPPSTDYTTRLQRGEADVMIIPREVFPDHASYPHAVLYQDRFVCAVGAANTDVGATITSEQFSRMPYLATSSPSSPSLAKLQLDFLGIPRNTKVSAGFGLARLLVRDGPMVTLLHERFARAINVDDGLRLLEPPMELQPITEIIVWTPRTERDPGNRWLRQRLLALAAALPEPDHGA
jgi:DNA-binding transcriptional LysR family regulator